MADKTVIAAAGGAAVGSAVHNSLQNRPSFYNASLDQILSGEFILIGSDIIGILGSILLFCNLLIAMLRLRRSGKGE